MVKKIKLEKMQTNVTKLVEQQRIEDLHDGIMYIQATPTYGITNLPVP